MWDAKIAGLFISNSNGSFCLFPLSFALSMLRSSGFSNGPRVETVAAVHREAPRRGTAVSAAVLVVMDVVLDVVLRLRAETLGKVELFWALVMGTRLVFIWVELRCVKAVPGTVYAVVLVTLVGAWTTGAAVVEHVSALLDTSADDDFPCDPKLAGNDGIGIIGIPETEEDIP